jgi:putative ABC transport system ATP-binding protein
MQNSLNSTTATAFTVNAPRRAVIDISAITKTYQMEEMAVQVLKGISMTVHAGEFMSIMGPSGSGKSTLMNILGALDKPTSGQYILDGTDISQMSDADLARTRNRKIGFVFQSYNLLKRTPAVKQVELPLIYDAVKHRRERAIEALTAVGLEQRLWNMPNQLSGGQQQRVAIARALVSQPAIIMADEPTGALDSRSGQEVLKILQQLNREKGITVIFVTHDPWVARHTNRIVMLRDGKLVADREVADPLDAAVSERPSEAAELESLFKEAYSANPVEFN